MRDGERVPFDGQECSRRADGWLVASGNFRRDGYLIAGPRYDKIMAERVEHEAKPVAYRVLCCIGRVLLFVLKALWMIIKVGLYIFMAVKMVQGIHDVEQTFSGPNSIANTNRNINKYINRQSQRR